MMTTRKAMCRAEATPPLTGNDTIEVLAKGGYQQRNMQGLHNQAIHIYSVW